MRQFRSSEKCTHVRENTKCISNVVSRLLCIDPLPICCQIVKSHTWNYCPWIVLLNIWTPRCFTTKFMTPHLWLLAVHFTIVPRAFTLLHMLRQSATLVSILALVSQKQICAKCRFLLTNLSSKCPLLDVLHFSFYMSISLRMCNFVDKWCFVMD